MVQILSGLTTYLLLTICCQEQHGEAVSIRRVRQPRNQIRKEALQAPSNKPPSARRWGDKAPKKMKKPHANL